MPDLPPFRPRGILGWAAKDGRVTPDISFLRFLDTVLRRSNSLEVQRTPTGSIVATLASTPPEGGQWLICAGQSLSKSDYPDLFDVVGNAYGETATTFNLPDLGGRTLVGADSIALGALGGNSSVTLAEANLPAHSHTVTDPGHTHTFTGAPHSHTITDPGHSHSVDEAAGAADASTGADVTSAVGGGTTSTETTGITVDNATAGGTNASASTGITIGNTGSGTPFDITPSAVGVNWLIKT